MTKFERDIVKSFNNFFEQNEIDAIAYRIKQHQFSSQVLDVLVDSLHEEYYLGVECKSISTKTGSLYFTQHFGPDQIVRIDDFLRRSGRKGILAVELRYGKGLPVSAHILQWTDLKKRYLAGGVGFTVEEILRFPQIKRVSRSYVIDAHLWKE
ncbi:MAG: hypothetical protein PHD13_01470 [Methanocellales archaeon]|nr:hypothetical protein [Methanocellales archaeon]MDD3290948.1 hypothetical protein [Methanocellales archaeon]MDD5234833.1 hypothetical protein [Methanocellales archaeon]MDD5484797.1 hypothetical protein [Methanocellales archaeon]